MRGKSEPILNLDIVVPSNTHYLSLIGKIAEGIAREAAQAEVDREALAFHLNLVVTEAMANAVKHGAQGEPTKTVRICVSIDDENLQVQLYDHGEGFELNAGTSEADALQEHGRGLFLMRSVMDSVEYRRAESGNVLEMRKSLAHEPVASP